MALKVLMVTTGYPRYEGDVFGCFIDDIALGLSREEEVTVLAPHAPGYPWREVKGNLKIFRMPYFFGWGKVAYGGGIPTNLKTWSCRLQLPFFVLAMSVYAFWFARKVDIIHAHWGVSACLSWPAALIWRKKLVVSYHGSDLHGSALIQGLSRFVAKWCDARICVAEEQTHQLPVSADVISYGLDIQRFSKVSLDQKQKLRLEVGIEKEALLMVYVGYLIPLKRVHLLLESLRHLESNVQLCIIGDGPLKEDLQSRIDSMKLSERVSLLGSVPYHEVQKIFQMADVHMLVSEREGKPNVVLQAMASSCPSVVTRAGGTVEQVLHGETGYFVEPTAEDIAEKVASLSDDVKREAMGAHARERLLSFGISISDIVEQHRNLYHRIRS
jgi:glycosyltransferase involved in cell wall biosynthesis